MTEQTEVHNYSETLSDLEKAMRAVDRLDYAGKRYMLNRLREQVDNRGRPRERGGK